MKKQLSFKGLCLLCCCLLYSGSALTEIELSKVNSGEVNLVTDGNTLNLQQASNLASIDWSHFNLASNQSVNFQVPNQNSITLNRITANEPTSIAGTIHSNGKLILLTKNDLIFSDTANVHAYSLLASSLALADDDFIAGNYKLQSQANPANIINQGNLTAEQNLTVVANFTNQGQVVAKLGNVQIASIDTATIDFNGDGLIQFALKDSSWQTEPNLGQKHTITNTGEISAAGLIYLNAHAASGLVSKVINLSGVLKSNANIKVGQEKTSLEAVVADNSLDNSGIVITADDEINLLAAAIYSPSGDIVIGGDLNKKSRLNTHELPVSAKLSIDLASTISTHTNQGSASNVVLWADELLLIDGTIVATTEAAGMSCGLIETSVYRGSLLLDNAKLVASVTEPNIKNGVWYLDPTDLIIDSKLLTQLYTNSADLQKTTGSTPEQLSNVGRLTYLKRRVAVDNIIDALNKGVDVILETHPDMHEDSNVEQGNIKVETNIAWDTDAHLTLRAYNKIEFGANGKITADLGNVTLATGTSKTSVDNTIEPFITKVNAGPVDVGGAVKIFYKPLLDYSASPYTYDASHIRSAVDFANITAGNESSFKSYAFVYEAADLAAINLTEKYVLANDIEISSLPNIGSMQNPFSGEFIGDKHKIYTNNGVGVSIDLANAELQGFFSVTQGAKISDLIFDNIKLTNAGDNTGVVVGTAIDTTLDGVKVVYSRIEGASNLGGLIGSAWSGNVLHNCLAYNVQLLGSDNVGGLVGQAVVGNKFTRTALNDYINYSLLNPDTQLDSVILGTGSNIGGLIGNLVDNNVVVSSYVSTGNALMKAIKGKRNVSANIGRMGHNNRLEFMSLSGVTVEAEENAGLLVGSLANQNVMQNINFSAFEIAATEQNVGGIIGQMGDQNLLDTFRLSGGDILGYPIDASPIGQIYSTAKNGKAGGIIGNLQDGNIVKNGFVEDIHVIIDGNKLGYLVGQMGSNNVMNNIYSYYGIANRTNFLVTAANASYGVLAADHKKDNIFCNILLGKEPLDILREDLNFLNPDYLVQLEEPPLLGNATQAAKLINTFISEDLDDRMRAKQQALVTSVW